MKTDTIYLTLGQAAKETGKSKSTIFKAIKSGVLSYIEKTSAGYKLDPEEVFMVFPVNDLGSSQGERSQTLSVSTEKRSTENDYLRRENDLLRQQIEQERETIDDLRRRLDDEASERRKLMLLLTHQPEQPEQYQTKIKPEQQPVKSLLWNKLFGRDR